ncbi:SHOCT domain-containing protein [Halalkalibacter sp. AB-rgal2]|uniref:SHOCT domain-containing protein n=1 Tax=Halalkalibacter sp. AB-rgal2 TaxID=3242695 RepID=UPI00359E9B62
MGFFSLKAVCAVCDQEAGLNRYRIAEKNWICPSCFKKAGLKKIGQMNKPINKMTKDDVNAAIEAKIKNEIELSNFSPTKSIGSFMEFDDNNKKWLALSSFLGKRNKSTVYNYSDIIDFELLEDGESVAQGGLGKALIGGALFGGTGAIVGGITGKRKNTNVCNSLKLKITVNDFHSPTVYVNFIESSTKRNGFIFKNIYDSAQECLSTLQLICDGQKNDNHQNEHKTSDADELIKFKQLLDAGAISQEEYDIKKSEILGT